MIAAASTAPGSQLDSVADLFRDAIACVRRDVPEAHVRFVAELGAIAAAMSIGTETFGLRHGRIVAAPGQTAVTLATDLATLRSLVDGRVALTAAVAERSLTIIGSPRTIAAIDRSLRLLLHGIVRSPAAPALMRRLHDLAQVAPSARASYPTEPSQPKEPS